MSPWHEDDRFWKTYAPFMFDERRWITIAGKQRTESAVTAQKK